MRTGDAGSQEGGTPPQAPERLDDIACEFFGSRGMTVCQSMLGVAPNAFVRVEFRGIGRESLEPKAWEASAQIADQIAFVPSCTVPDKDDVATEVSEELEDEVADLRLTNIVEVELVVEAEPMAQRADRNGRDDRDFVVTVGVAMDGGLAARSPSPAEVRNHQEAGFVDEYDVGAQPRSVFFTRGQSFRFQRSISCSLRCTARLSGFCGLQSRQCIKRPTWSRWYRTPKFLRITSAMRRVVHSSVGYPFASAPFSKIRSLLSKPTPGGLDRCLIHVQPVTGPARHFSLRAVSVGKAELAHGTRLGVQP